MKLDIKVGTTSKRMAIFIRDSSVSTGAGLTGLVFNSAGLTAYYWREDAGNTGGVAITLATATLGTWTSGGFIQKDSTNLPGMYEFDIPDAALATGAKWVVVELKGATNMVPVTLEIELVSYDPYDAVRLGLTALPNAAAEAAGGLYTRGAGAGQINQNANGQVDTNMVAISGDATAADNLETMLDGTGGQTFSLGQLNIVAAGNLDAIVATGAGTGHGVKATGGGTSGDGINATGGATNGRGLNAAGTGTGAGVRAKGGATGIGLDAEGGATSGTGLRAAGAAGNSIGFNAAGVGTQAGVRATGGTTDGDGISASGGLTNGHGIALAGVGTGAGLRSEGGATGAGIAGVGGATSGAGLSAAATAGNSDGIVGTGFGAGDGLSVTGGATGRGIDALGGATSGAGLRAQGNGNGIGIEAVGTSAQAGLNAQGAGNGFTVTGLAGHGMQVSGAGASNHGIFSQAPAGSGIQATGGGAGHGLSTAAGATGLDISLTNRRANILAAWNGTATAGAAGSITFDAGAPAVVDYFKLGVVWIIGGTGVGQARHISAYSAGRVASVTPDWVTVPDATSVFVSIPAGQVDLSPSGGGSVWDEDIVSGHTGAASAGTALGRILLRPGANWAALVTPGTALDFMSRTAAGVFDRATMSLEAISVSGGAAAVWDYVLQMDGASLNKARSVMLTVRNWLSQLVTGPGRG